MPSTSPAQHRLMEGVAHNPGFAKKVGIPQAVGQDFSEADKGRKFGKGGMAKPFAGKETYAEELSEAKEVKSGKITPEKFAKKEVKEEHGMKKEEKYARGGNVKGAMMNAMMKAKAARAPAGVPPTAGPSPMGFAKGGKVGYTREADGVAERGKTRGQQIKMKKGGKC